LLLLLTILGWIVCRRRRKVANLTGSGAAPMNHRGKGKSHQDSDQTYVFGGKDLETANGRKEA